MRRNVREESEKEGPGHYAFRPRQSALLKLKKITFTAIVFFFVLGAYRKEDARKKRIDPCWVKNKSLCSAAVTVKSRLQ